ncbi:MAG: GIY-YIG nuclease family protein [Salinisphaeraceae bacterium]|nr:GIY-YIG nuclease family protein [Salinisphaeraceae bacterium]
MSDWHLYILKTRIDTLYTGIATDVMRRLQEHESGKVGAKYLRAKAPLELVYQVSLGSRELASRAEYRVKQLSRSAKQALIERQPDCRDFLLSIELSSEVEETG